MPADYTPVPEAEIRELLELGDAIPFDLDTLDRYTSACRLLEAPFWASL